MANGDIQLVTRGGVTTLDMSNVNTAESRIHEVAYITPQKSGELLSVFNWAHLDLVGHIAKIELELRRAERRADEIRSVIILDKAKEILKEKGLAKDNNPAGSEGLRQAILDGDTEYQDALDRVAELKAMNEWFRGRSKSIEMAYHSVKKLIGDTFVSNEREVRTNGYLPESVSTGQQAPAGRRGYRKPVL